MLLQLEAGEPAEAVAGDRKPVKACIEAQIHALCRVQTEGTAGLSHEPCQDPSASGAFCHFATANRSMVDVLLMSLQLRKDAAMDTSKDILENCILLVGNMRNALEIHTKERHLFVLSQTLFLDRVQQQNVKLIQKSVTQAQTIEQLQTTSVTQAQTIEQLQTTIRQQQEKIQANESLINLVQQVCSEHAGTLQHAFSEHDKKRKASDSEG